LLPKFYVISPVCGYLVWYSHAICHIFVYETRIVAYAFCLGVYTFGVFYIVRWFYVEQCIYSQS
jgi:hypothetical protein